LRVLALVAQPHEIHDVDTRTLTSGRCSRSSVAAARVSMVGPSMPFVEDR
jgi:hypothetical protein